MHIIWSNNYYIYPIDRHLILFFPPFFVFLSFSTEETSCPVPDGNAIPKWRIRFIGIAAWNEDKSSFQFSDSSIPLFNRTKQICIRNRRNEGRCQFVNIHTEVKKKKVIKLRANAAETVSALLVQNWFKTSSTNPELVVSSLLVYWKAHCFVSLRRVFI